MAAEKKKFLTIQDRNRVQIKFPEKSRTHQSFKAECDVNNIMKKYERTGILEHRNTFQGQYGDFTNVPNDFHEAQNAVIAAEEMFMTLPAKVRRRFQNDAGEFIDFATDPANQEEMIKLGLAERRVDGEVVEKVSTPSKKPEGPSAGKKPASEAKPEAKQADDQSD